MEPKNEMTESEVNKLRFISIHIITVDKILLEQ